MNKLVIPKLEFQDVGYVLPDVETPILEGINLKIFPQDFILIVGGNGSGKTSFLKMIQQLIFPTSGKIFFNGRVISHHKSFSLAKEVVCIEQNINAHIFPNLTVAENFMIWNLRRSKEKNIDMKMYLEKFSIKLIDKLNIAAKYLSGGEKQALSLALAFIHPPLILLLDEHTSALDEKNKNQINNLTVDLVNEYKTTCLMVTHNLSDVAKFGNRLLAFRDGHLVLNVANDKKIKAEELLEACF